MHVIKDYVLARTIRTLEYEEWNCYFSKNDKIDRINKILIFFRTNVNTIYLLATLESDFNNKEYLRQVINLVHDLPIDFNLITEQVDYSEDYYLEKKVLEIKNKEGMVQEEKL